MAVATEVIRRSMSTLAGLFTKKLPAGIWQFTFDEVGKGVKYVVNGRRYEFMAINGVMGITIDATNEKQLWYVISDDCTVQIEEVGQSANPFFSIHQEEGIFTPTLSCTTVGNLAITYTTQTGYYTRIGELIYFNIFVQIATISHTTASGNWLINGLPFNSEHVNVYTLLTTGIDHASLTQIVAYLGSSTNYFSLHGLRDNNSPTAFAVATAIISNDDYIRINGVYRKA
jgi:hypothetical protein